MERLKPSIGGIVKNTLAVIHERRNQLAKALALPFLLLAALSIGIQEPLGNVRWFLFVPLVGLVTVTSVVTHRIALLGREAVPPWGLMRWTSRETYFAMHLAVLGCTAFLPLLLARAIQFPALVLAAPPMILYVWTRLGVVLPAAAIEQGISFRGAWQMTRNHQRLMILAVLLMAVFMAVVNEIVSALIPVSPLLIPLLRMPLALIPMILLSMAYPEIYAYEGEADTIADEV